MMKRIGLGKGLGKGYKNLVYKDPYIHSLSSRGIKTRIKQLAKNERKTNVYLWNDAGTLIPHKLPKKIGVELMHTFAHDVEHITKVAVGTYYTRIHYDNGEVLEFKHDDDVDKGMKRIKPEDRYELEEDYVDEYKEYGIYAMSDIKTISKEVSRGTEFDFDKTYDVEYTHNGKKFKRTDIIFDGYALENLPYGDLDPEYSATFKRDIIDPLKKKGVEISDWGYAEKGMWVVYLKEKVLNAKGNTWENLGYGLYKKHRTGKWKEHGWTVQLRSPITKSDKWEVQVDKSEEHYFVKKFNTEKQARDYAELYMKEHQKG